MEFKPEQLTTLVGSIEFLLNSMLATCRHVTSKRILDNKPFWMVQTEKFSSLFSRIKGSLEAVEKIRRIVIYPVYDVNNASMLDEIFDSEGKVQDEYLRITLQQSNDFKINVKPGGVYFQLDKLFLPISEVYTQAVNYRLTHKEENFPFPIHILLGFYASVYQSVKDKESDESMERLKDNINKLLDAMDFCDQPTVQAKGPADIMKRMLGNLDIGQLGEMMGKATGDPQTGKDMSEAFKKMGDVIKDGGNPLDMIGDLLKNASLRAAEADNAPPSADENEPSEPAEEQE